MARKPLEFRNIPDHMRERAPYGPYIGAVKWHVDGDTFDILIDVGVNDYPYRPIRLRNVDAPEIRRPRDEDERIRGYAALEWLRHEIPDGSLVIAKTYKDDESFGRYIADIELPDGTDLATKMVEAGHAVWSYQ